MSKLSIILATRGRPELLIPTIERTLPNIRDPNTSMLIACDLDDEKTFDALLHREWPRVTLSYRTREDSLGEKYNRGVAQAPGDAYLAMVDYAPHITEGFDERILEAASLFPDGIGVVYNYMANPSFPQINVVTHRLVELMGGFYPPWFPYWFIDHWLDDVAHMIDRIAFADVLIDVAYRPGTQDLREPAWWGTFFDLLMPERQAIAKRIIAALDEPEWRKQMITGRFPHRMYQSRCINDALRNAPWQIPNEVNFGDERYQRIKERAADKAREIVSSGAHLQAQNGELKNNLPEPVDCRPEPEHRSI